ncbi:MAG: hypothetical protein ACHQRM_17835 [Bacteroidia bacterium]
MEQATTEGAGAPKRPTFLTVLCILSFIGCAIGLFSGIKNYFDAKTMLTTANLTKEVSALPGADAKTTEAAVNSAVQLLGIDPVKISNGYLMIAILNVVVLAGAVMMWMLKKTGFYIYTVGQVAGLGVMFGYIGGLAGGLMGIVTAVFAIAFIIMYGVNLKAMK